MANTTIKVSQLPNIGLNLNANTLMLAVSTNGTYSTDKINLGNLANYVLSEAGNLLQEAYVSELAYSVTNSAQPNITSVGTLNINTLHISGGTNGYVLQTNGSGNLNWTMMAGSGNGDPGGANSQVQFNDEGAFNGNPNFTFDPSTDTLSISNIEANNITVFSSINTVDIATSNLTASSNITANYFIGNGSQLSGITANAVGSGPNLSVQFNNDGQFDGDANLIYDIDTFTLNVTNLSANYLSGDGSNISNILPLSNGNSNINFTEADGNFVINVNNSFSWTFGIDSNITLPGNCTISHSGIDYVNVDITAGPNGWVELQSNDRNNYVWVDNDGAYIATHYLVSPTQWTFNRNGNLNVPGNIDYNGDGDFFIGSYIGNTTLSGKNHSTINTDGYNWDFDNTGNLTFPDTSVQNTAWTGTVDTGNVTGLGNIATINADGNSSNVLLGTGIFSGVPLYPNALVWTTAPLSNVSEGVAGQVAYDSGGNLFICVATNTWSKITGTTSW